MAVIVYEDKCDGCGSCEEVCPVEAIRVVDGVARVNLDECVDCGTCVQECFNGALALEE